MTDIFDAIDEAREEDKKKKKIDLGPISKMVEKQVLLEKKSSEVVVELLYKTVLKCNASVDDIEELLKRRKKDLFNVRQVQIPTMMDEFELDSITTKDGIKIEIKDGLSVTVKDQPELYKFIIKDGSGDLIKKLFTVSIENDEIEKEVEKKLEMIDCLFEKKESIHWQTLQKYVRGRMEKGKSIPEKLLTIFEYKYSKIQKIKRKR